ncbi:hypothetical protein ABFB09_01560 [Dehalogenimonas sp. THU2]|uniref:hypothetical protein n=1 Tax=Dehalogenimonas sp. THU2 TaxID=3151121 RepID=UPI0032184645
MNIAKSNKFEKSPTKGELESLLIVNILASFGFIAIIALSGDYKATAFWIAAVLVTGIAYAISYVPDRLKLLRYTLIAAGFFAPGAIGPILQTEQSYSAAGLVFLMALFWLPLIKGLRHRATPTT